ncbi:MAG: hypothetical protein ACFBZ9_17275 [Sphingomonadales bacterium]
MTVQTPISTAGSRIRRKYNIDVDIVLHDGTQISGNVFLMKEERVQDLLNDPRPFFPIRLPNQEIMLINKSAVAVCKPIEVVNGGS